MDCFCCEQNYVRSRCTLSTIKLLKKNYTLITLLGNHIKIFYNLSITVNSAKIMAHICFQISENHLSKTRFSSLLQILLYTRYDLPSSTGAKFRMLLDSQHAKHSTWKFGTLMWVLTHNSAKEDACRYPRKGEIQKAYLWYGTISNKPYLRGILTPIM